MSSKNNKKENKEIEKDKKINNSLKNGLLFDASSLKSLLNISNSITSSNIPGDKKVQFSSLLSLYFYFILIFYFIL